jgi:hypothetical protein
MLIGIILVLVAVFLRFVSDTFHTWHLVPMGAIALYAGARLPRRWAWIVPAVAMVISDLVIDYGRGRSIAELSRWVGYATLAGCALFGPLANKQKLGVLRYPVLSLGVSVLFFLTSNFAVWAEGQIYPMTAAGLLTCYYFGIPFFWPTLAADLAGTVVFFGLGPGVERAFARLGFAHADKPTSESELAASSRLA